MSYKRRLSARVPSAVAGNRERRMLFDASALAKRYASEPGHERMLVLLDQADEVWVAAHCQCELAAALLQRHRDGSLPLDEFDRAWAAAQRDVADMGRVALDDTVERFAFAALHHRALRVSDALHIGSALAARVDLFVTADRRQAEAARGLGLRTEYLGEPAMAVEGQST